MFKDLRIGCAIPARLKSVRFPNKILADFGGKTLLERVFDSAKTVPFWDQMVILVDDPTVCELCKQMGAPVVMSPVECDNGTERLSWYLEKFPQEIDVWVIWQADEPMICLPMIETLLSTIDCPQDRVWTLQKEITESSDLLDPSIVKVVTDVHGRALYFSRAPIPYPRDGGVGRAFKHVGLYAYRRDFLADYLEMSPVYLEQVEKLEQLRYLAHRESIRIHTTNDEPFGINFPHELPIALAAWMASITASRL